MSGKVSRRAILSAVPASVVLSQAGRAAGRDAFSVDRLTVNGAPSPLGLDAGAIRLGWQLTSDRRACVQVAYRVCVASSAEALAAGACDVWDSGKVASDDSFDVAYKGPELAVRCRAVWTVTVWDNHGRTATSRPSSWEMGLLAPEDWTAKWIAVESPEVRADREAGLPWLTKTIGKAGQTRQFRLSFHLDQDAQVTLFTGANAGHRVFLDGAAVTLPAHAPHSMGDQGVVETRMALARGPHVVALSVDDLVGFGELLNGTPRGCILVKARYASGEIVRFSGVDARASDEAPDGWTGLGFPDTAWDKARRIEGAGRESLGAAWPGTGAYLVRRDFTAAKPARARLYVTALGGYRVYLNGQPVNDTGLSPEVTDFRKTILYRTYDVTSLIAAGDNVLAAMIGDGWYGSYAGPRGRYPFGEAPLRFLCQLEIEHVDGTRTVVTSDDTWRLSHAAVTKSEIYDGEDYDARLEQPGWDRPGFAEKGLWWPAAPGPVPAGRLKATLVPPIRRTMTLKPTSVIRVGDAFVADFGQNFAGWAEIKVKGQAGQRVELRFAEILQADGHADQSNLRGARAADIYTLRGDPAGEVYAPHFTYHGFRYVEVTGLPSLDPADILGIVVHSDLLETGALRVNNALIHQLWENTVWSQRSNFMGIPTDCPQRDERLGWMGDAHVFWDAAAFNMDTQTFGEKWTGDIRDAQSASGAYTDVSPDTIHLGDATGASPGWAEAGVIVPWTLWKRYGDRAVIDQNWEAMRRYLAFIEENSDDFIWTRMRGSDFGDWLALDAKQPGDPTTPKDLVATAMWKKSTDAMVDMARASGRGAEAATYQATAGRIKQAFGRHFVQADGTIGNGSQTGYILALKHDLVPDGLQVNAAKHLVADIRRRGGLLSTGFLGTPISLDTLADAGYDAVVYDLLLRTAFPSWGYMVAKGATTIWERWNGDTGDVSMNSFNHYALGSVCGFAYRRIAGIDPLTPGFKTFRFDPVLDVRVAKAGADYAAVVGPIRTDWTSGANGRFELTIEVPANSRAQVVLPAGDGARIRESGKALASAGGVTVVGVKDGKTRLEIGSGRYSFTVN